MIPLYSDRANHLTHHGNLKHDNTIHLHHRFIPSLNPSSFRRYPIFPSIPSHHRRIRSCHGSTHRHKISFPHLPRRNQRLKPAPTNTPNSQAVIHDGLFISPNLPHFALSDTHHPNPPSTSTCLKSALSPRPISIHR